MLVGTVQSQATTSTCAFTTDPKPTANYWIESPLSDPIYVTVPAFSIVESTDISANGTVCNR